MRKGQMEVIGLVVIVILISLGLLFAARFALQDESGKKVFTRKGLASSMVSAALKTTIPADANCAPGVVGDTRLQIGADLLEDCALNLDTKDIPEGRGYSRYQCYGKHSCKVVEDTLKLFSAGTLDQWHKKYQFKAELVNLNGPSTTLVKIPINGRACSGATDRDTSGLFPLQTEEGLFIETILYICD